MSNRKISASLKKARGTFHPARENKKEPQYPIAKPRDPNANLGKYGRELWERIFALLAEKKVITEADTAAMLVLCSAYDRAMIAQEFFSKDYLARVSDKDNALIITQMNRDLEMVRKLLVEFGLTPKSRGAVESKNAIDADDANDPVLVMLND